MTYARSKVSYRLSRRGNRIDASAPEEPRTRRLERDAGAWGIVSV
jgi:hypothetical protein